MTGRISLSYPDITATLNLKTLNKEMRKLINLCKKVQTSYYIHHFIIALYTHDYFEVPLQTANSQDGISNAR